MRMILKVDKTEFIEMLNQSQLFVGFEIINILTKKHAYELQVKGKEEE